MIRVDSGKPRTHLNVQTPTRNLHVQEGSIAMTSLPRETGEVLRLALAMEELGRPDWDAVAELCDGEIRRLNETGLETLVNGLPYQLLEDHDVRRKHFPYGEHQRQRLKAFLQTLG